MAITSNPAKTTTVEEFINCEELIKISYSNLSLRIPVDGDIDMVLYNVLDDYIEEFKERAVLVELSDEEYIKYCQAPKLIAYDFYKNTELDFIILRLNGIYDDKDLDMKNIYLLSKDDMKELTSQLYNAEKKFIQSYNDKHSEEG